MPRRLFQTAADAASPIIGVLLTVAITVILGAIVFSVSSRVGEDRGLEPRVAFFTDEGGTPGGILTVVEITNGPLPMSSLSLAGTSHATISCAWSRTSGDLAPGDQLACAAAGTVVITELTHQVLLYSGILA